MPVLTYCSDFRKQIASLLLPAIVYLFPISVSAQESVSSKEASVSPQYRNEIQTLAAQPIVKAAFQTIMDLEPETIKNLITLTQIPSPPFKEQARAEKFRTLLQASGVDSIWTDNAGNVIALRRGTTGKKTIVIEGHLDTVFPEGTDVTVKQHGDTLLAPGISDDTRALSVVLTLLKSMNRTNIKTEANILFVGTTGEEGLGDLRGVKQLFNSGQKIDTYISVDGGPLGNIVYGAVGSRRYRVTFKGDGGHSYGAFGMVNPHNATARAIQHFISEADTFTRKGPKTTYNIGRLGGGTSVNAIPFESWMEVDMRSESAASLAMIDSMLKKAVQLGLKEENAMKRSGRDLTVSVDLIGERPTGTQDPTIPLIQHAGAAALYMGATPRLSFSSTNANVPISKGVPGITIWIGGKGGGAHSLNEWWINDKGYEAIQAAMLLLLSEARLAK